MEIVQESPRVILDGAHNPDKMAGLTANLQRIGAPRRRIFVFGCLNSHDYTKMAGIVATVADEVIVTSPSATQRTIASTGELAEAIRRAGRPVEVVPEPLEAIATALGRAEAEDEIVVTGSLYLVGEVRERWYHSEDIVLAQTCWPRLGARA
jgi:dihydrofolate synthase/folylpolyglutamate synthase